MRRTTRPTSTTPLDTGTPPHEDGRRPEVERGIAGYRLLRRIATGDRADVFLARSDRHVADELETETEAPLVAIRVYPPSVPGESIAIEIAAMDALTHGALPALYDITTLDDGRCCLAVERLSGPVLSRLLAQRTLDPGEAVTILAPVIAAVAELAARGFVHSRLSTSDVIIDATGRPRLIGLGSLERLPASMQPGQRTSAVRAGHEVLAELIGEVVQATRPADVFDGVLDLLRDRLAMRPFTPFEREAERAMFEAATPLPIAGLTLRRRPAAVPSRMIAPLDDEVDDLPAAAAPPRRLKRGVLSSLAEIAQLPLPVPSAERIADVADRDHTATLVGRLRGRLAGRRTALLVGGLVGGAALVLMLTLVPPAPPADPGTAAERASGAGPAGEASPSPIETPPPPIPVDEEAAPSAAGNPQPKAEADAEADVDVVSATAQLLELRETCFATLDQACLAQVAQPQSAIERADLDRLAEARSGDALAPAGFALDEISVSAEMGSAVLLTVPYLAGEREPASLLVMRSEAGWRLRELFD